ncbi:MAG: polysaccharide biosynthesis tyrosine autokinase [Chthoniobacteraceae bacterium]
MIPGLKKRKVSLHDVFMYVALVQKHTRLIGLLVAVAFLGALNYYIYARPIYYSKAMVRMDYVPQPMDVQNVFQDGQVNTILGELKSPMVIERTAARFGIHESARSIEAKIVRQMRIGYAGRRSLQVEIWAISKDLTDNWARVLIEEHEAFRRERHQREKDSIYNTYTQAIQDAAAKMGDSLDQKMNLQDSNQTIQAQIQLQRYQGVPAELVRMARRIDDMGRVKMQLEDPSLDIIGKLSLIASLDTDRQLAATSSLKVGDQVEMTDRAAVDGNGAVGQASPNVIVVPSLVPTQLVWRELDKLMQEAQREMAEKSALFLPGHRAMRALQIKIDDLKQRVEVEYLGSKRRFDLEYQELINRRKDLEGQIGEYAKANKESQLANSQNAIFRLSRINWETMISEMQKKLEALEYAWDRERMDLIFLNVRDSSDRPTSPDLVKLLIMAASLGVVLGLGVPFLIEYLDHTIHSLDEVENACQLRGLGIVPKHESNRPLSLLATGESSGNDLVENFRVIRTNLLSIGSVSKQPQVIMVTSAMPKEGKTVVATNLAISFARNGGRTLLFDADLRRGRMHRLFGYRKSPGLSNVLLDEVSLADGCRPTSYENLFVLSAGKHLDTGTELLASQKFTDILTTLRGQFDHIIVDTPPVLGLSETSILHKLTDGVLFVIWSGNTPMGSVKAAVDMLQKHGASFYGFVLNRLDLDATQNYYQYYYYSHDYYYNYRPATLEQA